jgi:hypothetical protein
LAIVLLLLGVLFFGNRQDPNKRAQMLKDIDPPKH